MAINEILGWLIDRHWRDLQIGREHAHAATDLSEREVELEGRRRRLSERTIRNMLSGHVTRPTRHTCRVLAELFRPHIPGISWRWFHNSADEFRSLVLGGASNGEAGPAGDLSDVLIERDGDDALEGTYLGYRHAFSANRVDRIAREVLHIYKGKSGLAFRMSYLPGTTGRSDVVMEFRGAVEAARPSMVLFGRSVGAGIEKRFRTFNACNNGHIDQPELVNYKLGLLASTREGDGVPCTACTLLIKVQRRMEGEDDLNAFMKAATRTDTFEEIVGRDFAREDWMLLSLFLDNRPTRSPKNLDDAMDAALNALEGPGPRDPVLRIAQDRFERNMEGVLQRALSARHIVPTFRADWSPATQEDVGVA